MRLLPPELSHRLLDEHDFAVVDPLLVEALPPDLPAIPMAPLSLVNEAHLMPMLVPLNEASEAAKTACLEGIEQAALAGRQPAVSTLLRTDADPERVRTHAAARIVLPTKTLGSLWLRWHDPRVFLQLRWMFRPELLRTLFGPVHACTLFHAGGWHCAEVDASSQHAAWRTSVDEDARLLDIGLINDTLVALPPLARVDEVAQSSRAIHELLQRARHRHGLSHEDDLRAFALQGMTVHAAFDDHPLIRPLLQHCAPDDTYADRSAVLEQVAWQRVAAELNAGQPVHLTEQIRRP